MNRSFAAFLIALLLHIVIALVLHIALTHVKQPSKENNATKRFKVSLKEKPDAKKSALLNNQQAPTPNIPPIPQGKQLKQIAPPLKQPTSSIKKRPDKQAKPPKPPKSAQEAQSDKPAKKPTKKEKTLSDTPKKPTSSLASKLSHFQDNKPEQAPKKTAQEQNQTHSDKTLYDRLSKQESTPSDSTNKQTHSKRENLINQDIKELYGEDFAKLSEGEQKYILDNQEIIRRTTQSVLNRVGRINIPDNFRVNSYNIIEFYLHPNGDISDMKLIERSGFYLLDNTTKETIEYAYSKYPPVNQKTLIRFKVGYYLRGY